MMVVSLANTSLIYLFASYAEAKAVTLCEEQDEGVAAAHERARPLQLGRGAGGSTRGGRRAGGRRGGGCGGILWRQRQPPPLRREAAGGVSIAGGPCLGLPLCRVRQRRCALVAQQHSQQHPQLFGPGNAVCLFLQVKKGLRVL